MKTQHKQNEHADQDDHYLRFALMIIASFIAMYILMYSMVDSFANVINNFNQVYMAALMTAAMVLIEIVVMRHMYTNKKVNRAIISAGVIVLITSCLFIRKQMAVSDKQFLKSMIPHHAAAILMVKEAQVKDPEIQKLANEIISAQQKEIDFMKEKLKQLEGN